MSVPVRNNADTSRALLNQIEPPAVADLIDDIEIDIVYVGDQMSVCCTMPDGSTWTLTGEQAMASAALATLLNINK